MIILTISLCEIKGNIYKLLITILYHFTFQSAKSEDSSKLIEDNKRLDSQVQEFKTVLQTTVRYIFVCI